jgi:hypothetical protein
MAASRRGTDPFRSFLIASTGKAQARDASTTCATVFIGSERDQIAGSSPYHTSLSLKLVDSSHYEEGSTNPFVDSVPGTALGSDTGRSSVRFPASGCGLVGGSEA